MNTPEVPPQPLPEVAAVAPGTDASHAAPDASPNGHSSSAESTDAIAVPAAAAIEAPGDGHSDGPTNSSAEGAHDVPADAAAQPGQEPPGQEKKRRRRRRRKKPGAQATTPEGDSTEGQQSESEDAAPEGAVALDGERVVVPDRRPKKKERRPGPPRERPPVNAGDIVFGKILEITDDAILIDIPGKARAIFDRREMLLPDDDEPARPSRTPPAAAADEEPSHDAAPTAEVEAAADVASDVEAAARGTAVAQTAVEPTLDPSAVALADGAPAPQQSVEAPPPARVEPVEATQEPPKEPKVPRVILEVGTDFIGVVYGDGSRGGLVVLTHHPHRAEKAKPIVEKACADMTPVEGLVTGVIKGGIEVDVDGLRAFAPGSHVELRLGADLSHLVGKRLPFLVTQYAKRGRDVVLSRRSMLEEEARKARTEALAKLKVGDELDGVVRSVVAFGAFIDVGGIEGLVPLQEMSHNRADGPSDVFKAGESTRVKVLKIDDRGKVWLSRKATIADPWQQVAQKYAMGTRHQGKVARLHPFGAFIELEPGVDGLIHTQDLSIKRIEAPEEVTKVGDSIDVVVAHVDPGQHKIGLHPAPQGDAANEAAQRVVAHKPIKAKVVLVEAGGVLVRILGVTGRSARGYVTAAGTGTPRGTELRKVFTVGQEIEAKVIEIDPRRGEAKLSIKALSEDQERSAYQQYRQQLKAEARFTFGDLLAKKGTPPR
jgi:small subunit ribosomal protein S1